MRGENKQDLEMKTENSILKHFNGLTYESCFAKLFNYSIDILM